MPRASTAICHSAFALATLLAIYPRFTAAATSTTYIGPDGGLWSSPGNWSNGLPNSSAFDAVINNPSPVTVQLNVPETINNLSLSSPDTLSLLAGLSLAGATLTNTGTIVFNATASQPTLSSINPAGVTFSGGGSMLLSSPGSLINGASGTLTTDNFISGQGALNGFKFVNTGTISATTGQLTITPASGTNGFNNAGLLLANGNTLTLNNGVYVNANGVIEALSNSLVRATGTITGGSLIGLGGTISVTGTITNASLAGNIRGSNLTFMGSDTNAGNYSANQATFFTNATFANSGNLVLGVGTFVTNSTINNSGTFGLFNELVVSQSPSAFTGGGTLLLGPGGSIVASTPLGSFVANTTIKGVGNIDGGSDSSSSNTGLIIASGGNLSVLNLANTNILRADGATLTIGHAISAIKPSIANTGGTIEAINGGLVKIVGGVDGGTIQALSNSSVSIGQAGLLMTISNATIAGNGGQVAITGSPLTLQNDSFSGSVTASNSTLTLTGTITNAGNLTFGGNVQISSTSVATIVNTGTFTLNGSSFPNNLFVSGNTLTLLSAAGTLDIKNGIVSLGAPSTIGAVTFTGTDNTALPALSLFAGFSFNGGTLGTLAAGNSAIYLNNSVTLSADTTMYHVGLGGTATLFSPVVTGPGRLIVGGGSWYSGSFTTPVEITANGTAPPVSAGWRVDAPDNNPNFIIGTAGTKAIDGVSVVIDAGASVDWLNYWNPSWNTPAGTGHEIVFRNGGSLINNGIFYIYIYDSIAQETFKNQDNNSANAFYNHGTFGRRNFNALSNSSVLIQVPTFNDGFIDVQDNLMTFAGGFQDISTPATPSTFNVASGATLAFSAGAVSISAPLSNINGTLLLNASSQSVSTISGSGRVSVGATLTSDAVLVSSLTLTGAATHTIRPNGSPSGTSKLTYLSLATDTSNAFTTTLNLNDNKLILQSDPTVLGDKSAKASFLQSALLSGMHGGDWLGPGITSGTVAADHSAAGSHLTTLGLYDNADLGLTTFGGQSVDSNSLLIATALIADTNLDGAVNAADFQNWYAHVLHANPFTDDGDFNHDGVVDGLDFDLWFAAAGANATPILNALGLDPAALSALRAPASVPEPASGMLLLTISPFLLKRRPKHR